MNQFAMGMSVAWIIGWCVFVWNRGRVTLRFFWLVPLCMLIGGLWAVIPDLPRLIGAESLYHRFAHDPRMNIFFFHHLIDQIETDAPWGMAILALQAISLQTMLLLHLRHVEQGMAR